MRKPLQSALSARRETIRAQIDKAQKERDEAEASLAEAQSLLAGRDADVQNLREQTRKEVELERKRLAASAEQEIEKLQAQAARQIAGAHKLAQRELQQFLATRSLELARNSVISQLRPEDDDRFIKDRLEELGRARG